MRFNKPIILLDIEHIYPTWLSRVGVSLIIHSQVFKVLAQSEGGKSGLETKIIYLNYINPLSQVVFSTPFLSGGGCINPPP